MRNYKKNKGFTLLELILVLGISTLAYMAYIQMEARKAATLKCEAAGEQMKEIGKALGFYILKNQSNLLGNMPSTGTEYSLPIDALRTANTVSFGNNANTITGLPILATTSAGYSNTSILSGVNTITINAYLLRTTSTSGDVLTGLVVTNAPLYVTGSATQPDYPCLGQAIKKMGNGGGGTLTTATQADGYGGGWILTKAQGFTTAINNLGLLAYKTQSSENYDDIYLRLDGLYPMKGDLNAGNYNITNATDINFNGWLYGNNALIANLHTGNIINDGEIKTNSINGYTYDSGTGSSKYAELRLSNYMSTNNNVVVGKTAFDGTAGDPNASTAATNEGNLFVSGDIYIKNGNAPGTSGRRVDGWLSDRLPQYVSRGAQLVTIYASSGAWPGRGMTTVARPYCGTTGTAKIEVIPQSILYYANLNYHNYSFPQDWTQTTLTNPGIAFQARAWVIDNSNVSGNRGAWEVWLYPGDPPGNKGGGDPSTGSAIPLQNFYGGYVLAHTYCDYGK